ncbi:MAG: DUF559 domain-containing protein [Actinobacteria bacterium]|nr:DUF559 domain-containing protein [Actinomycetota bacterium]
MSENPAQNRVFRHRTVLVTGLRDSRGMGRVDREVKGVAALQAFQVTRDQVIGAGGSDDVIENRVAGGSWVKRHAGVYQIDSRPSSWEADLIAAVLAAGEKALVSHRAALLLWGMDGISSAPIEITVPFGNLPIPEGVVVHRTRRPVEAATVRMVPITTPERTLLDCAAILPPLIIAKALESALRKRLTTVDRVNELLATKGGRGVRGTKKLRRAVAERVLDTATDSGSETELLFHMRKAFLPEPELHHEFFSKEGKRMLPDFYWPDRDKAVEVDGLDAHDSADRLDHDLRRQNALLDLGIELRRFSARDVRRKPVEVVEEIRRFLAF